MAQAAGPWEDQRQGRAAIYPTRHESEVKTKPCENDNPASTTIFGTLAEASQAVGSHRTVCCVGVLDGVHLGHQRLVGAAVDEARRRRCRSVVFTFRNHPLTVLAPAYAPLMLTDPDEKARRLAALGPSLVAMLEFNRALADLEPELFIEEVLARQLYVVSLWCGADFRFGRGGRGNVKMLEESGRRLGIEVRMIEPVTLHDRVVSSTWIRTLIEEGAVAQAAECLGRKYQVRAEVMRGHGRGRELGYPTANLVSPPGVVVPGDGIYAVQAEHGSRAYDGVMHVGPCPTFALGDRRLEVHLFDFQGDLVGRTVVVSFVQRLRDVASFDSAQALVVQIREDVKQARKVLARPHRA